jgi:hypothetical protein
MGSLFYYFPSPFNCWFPIFISLLLSLSKFLLSTLPLVFFPSFFLPPIVPSFPSPFRTCVLYFFLLFMQLFLSHFSLFCFVLYPLFLMRCSNPSLPCTIYHTSFIVLISLLSSHFSLIPPFFPFFADLFSQSPYFLPPPNFFLIFCLLVLSSKIWKLLTVRAHCYSKHNPVRGGGGLST